MNRRMILCLLLVLCSLSASATETKLFGVAKDYAGKKLSLLAYTDKIINGTKTIAETEVDSAGNFTLSANINEVTEAFIPMEVYNGFIFMQPGKNYEIILPAYRERNLPMKLDPYFEPSDYLLQAKEFQKGELNYQMMEFEEAFDFYTMKHMTYGAPIDSVQASISDLRRIFIDLDDDFQFQFKEYRYLLLLSLAPKIKQDSLIRQFNKVGADVHNPAFWDLFNSIFDDFVRRKRDEIEISALFDKIIETENVKMFFALLSNQYGLTDSNLKELVGIKILYDLSNSDFYDRTKLVSMMRKLGGGILSDSNRELLANVIVKSSINLSGSPAPDLEGIDTQEKPHKLSEYKGKYVYINFCNSRIDQTHKDLTVLSRFKDQYKDRLEIVNVFLFDDINHIKSLESNFRNKMVFLNANEPDLVKKAFGLKNIPSFMLIDKESNFLLSRGAAPSDELRMLMEQILKK
ncbi:MAG: redoxin domain-containing protein [Paludibacteraceae bacterium]|nr:redoxin domain-containing protein [Paludibacteraceae bacterium]